MISFLKKLEIYTLKAKSYKLSAGMTYVELIVVLSIFSVLSSVVIFNYGDFQARVDIKNLASDIALQIVQAQKSALAGSLPTQTPTVSPWKPSYGVYFSIASSYGADSKNFIYFTDLNNSKTFDSSSCPTATGECLNKITITKGNSISRIDACYATPCIPNPSNGLSDLTISFSRPNSGAIIGSSTYFTLPVSYIQITITSPKGAISNIKLYPSGRVQIN